MTGHIGDPCIFCHKKVEDFEIGDCSGRESRQMFADAIDDLQAISHNGPGAAVILPREAKSIIEQLQELVMAHRRSDRELCRILGISPAQLDRDTTQRDFIIPEASR